MFPISKKFEPRYLVNESNQWTDSEEKNMYCEAKKEAQELYNLFKEKLNEPGEDVKMICSDQNLLGEEEQFSGEEEQFLGEEEQFSNQTEPILKIEKHFSVNFSSQFNEY